MTPRTLASLVNHAKRLDAAQAKYRERVTKASKGRAHHQGCYLGGMWRGMPCDVSGSPCWCGAVRPVLP